MDITLKLLVNPPVGVTSGRADMMRPRRGDVISVYRASDWSTLQGNGDYLLDRPNLSSHLAFIHIKNIPTPNGEERKLNKIRERLTDVAERLSDDQSGAPVGVYFFTPIRHRSFRLLFSSIPAGVRNDLRNQVERTFEWNQVKPYIRKRNIVNHLNRSQDTELTQLSDVDIND